MEIIRKGKRTYELSIEGKKLETPTIIPSVSSTVSSLSIYESLDILMQKNSKSFLFSAFDYYHEKNIEDKKKLKYVLETASKRGTMVFLDSGGYEALQVRKDWNIEQFLSVVEQLDLDAYFSYDTLADGDSTIEDFVDRISEDSLRTMSTQNQGITIPVLHSFGFNWNEVIETVVRSIHPKMIAIPEDDLGKNLEDKVNKVREIRSVLDSEHNYIPLHILGVGKPIPILLYSLAGADTFDGLGWLTSLIDPIDLNTNEIEYSNFFPMDCKCTACLSKKQHPKSWKAMHNLDFLATFTSEIRYSLVKGDIEELVTKYSIRGELEKMIKTMWRQ